MRRTMDALDRMLAEPRPRKVVMPNGVSIDTSMSGAWPGNVVAFAPGNAIQVCPTLACDKTAPVMGGHLNSAYFSSRSEKGAGVQENTVMVNTLADKGYTSLWQPSTQYREGDAVRYALRQGNAVYEVVKSGTSAASGDGPRGAAPGRPDKSGTIRDGSVVWRYAGPGALSAKTGIYNEMRGETGAGQIWAQANNLNVKSGNPAWFVTYEGDLSNNTGRDYVPNGPFSSHNIYLVTGGTGTNTSAITLGTHNTQAQGYGSYWGMRIAGAYTVKETAIELATQSKVGLGFNTFPLPDVGYSEASIKDNADGARSLFVTRPKTVATIVDASQGTPVSLLIAGTKTQQGIKIEAETPIGVDVGGTVAGAAYKVSGSAGTGVDLSTGNFSEWQILGRGFSVGPAGGVGSAAFATTAGAKLADALTLPASTVRQLPRCGRATLDQLRVVSDAVRPSYNEPIRGGGKNRIPVYCDGRNWTAH
ncbi:hypothetical protein [Jiella pelagia]|uniref:Uncharacterized protein n=1 Tax=Jiella pelagia TaxID=2986949 RepID=A0ABY7C4U9_9HYPH|nr:hypothetical protein [Jiella pelagia]WAP68855.1 hypothetical protein OH818_27155 [Jiella pelagia]